MKIDTQLLLFCAEKTKTMADAYSATCVFPEEEEFPRSADDLEWLIKGETGIDIRCNTLRSIDRTAKVRAATVFRSEGPRVYFVSGLEDEELRYLKTKELFQIYLASEPFHTRDMVDLIRNMILRSSPESIDLDLGRATTAETLAELAAQEFLYPMADRVAYLAAGGGGDGIADLVRKYGVPHDVVSYCIFPPLVESLKGIFLGIGSNGPQ